MSSSVWYAYMCILTCVLECIPVQVGVTGERFGRAEGGIKDLAPLDVLLRR